MENTLHEENTILGSIISDPSMIDDVADILSMEDFSDYQNRKIYKDIIERHRTDQPIDAFTIAETTKIDVSNIIERQQSAFNTVSAVSSYAKQIKTKQKRARLTEKLQAYTMALQDQNNSIDELTQALELDILKIQESENEKRGYNPITNAIKKAVNNLERRTQLDNKLDGLATGIASLDELFMGLRAGDLVIIAGRPSMGKTALALNIAENNVDDYGMIHSLEMTEEELAERMIASAGVADYGAIMSGRMDTTQWGLVTNGIGRLNGKNLYIDDSPNQTIQHIRASALRAKAKYGKVGYLMVDYLQLIKMKGFNAVAETGEVSKTLKNLGKELGCPVIVLSQLSRECEKRADKRPINSDLRDSGQIEQDADKIVMVYQDRKYNEESPWQYISELIVTKNRGGKTGTCYAVFQGHHQRFVEADYNEVERIKSIAQQPAARPRFNA
ncbi:replicative DNA helicase [Pseudoalteromonas sp.]|uniref:replicative DNA helicase n=1 Tax=Pseudoalteromonas sp. TaxID=53249 RepID=UPI003566474F